MNCKDSFQTIHSYHHSPMEHADQISNCMNVPLCLCYVLLVKIKRLHKMSFGKNLSTLNTNFAARFLCVEVNRLDEQRVGRDNLHGSRLTGQRS